MLRLLTCARLDALDGEDSKSFFRVHFSRDFCGGVAVAIMAGNPQDYYNCICQWLQAHEGAMHQLINQLRGSNSALCTQTECFESGMCACSAGPQRLARFARLAVMVERWFGKREELTRRRPGSGGVGGATDGAPGACGGLVRAGFGAREDAAPTEPGLPLVQIMILVGLLMAVMTAMRPERAERRSSPNALLEKPAPGLGEPFPPPPPAL